MLVQDRTTTTTTTTTTTLNHGLVGFLFFSILQITRLIRWRTATKYQRSSQTNFLVPSKLMKPNSFAVAETRSRNGRTTGFPATSIPILMSLAQMALRNVTSNCSVEKESYLSNQIPSQCKTNTNIPFIFLLLLLAGEAEHGGNDFLRLGHTIVPVTPKADKARAERRHDAHAVFFRILFD
ncbi:hypothetical protein HC256_000876 [Beauveria bassiana]|nr:hypothetical protein HC256_000876 [Beauveria bassiana]